jgi:hypothetical protein
MKNNQDQDYSDYSDEEYLNEDYQTFSSKQKKHPP